MTGHLLGAARGATRQAPNRSAASRDAIVVGDGGDFVSFAGRVWETWEPGTWMDPGPYGCLGAGPGQAIGVLTDPEVVYPRRANLA